ncbi:MAG: hypothetical protein KAS75_03430 [Planctomycetes bacterium]|nr:hypothetical protein [Planctomycetota bacterium]
MKKKMIIIILRWVAVLPGAILFVLLCHFPIHWIVLLREYIPDKVIEFNNPAKLEYLLYAFFDPFLLIIAAAFIAPSKKFWAGMVFTVLMFLFGLSVMIYSKQKGLVTYSAPELTFLINIIGCAVGLGYVYSKYLMVKKS